MKQIRIRLGVAALALALAGGVIYGCGGAGRENAPVAATRATGLHFRLQWPQRTRAAQTGRAIPQAAQSVRFQLFAGDPDYNVKIAEKLVVRPAGAAPTSDATFNTVPVLVNLRVVITALPNADGTGVAQGLGAAIVTTGDSGTTTQTQPVAIGTTVVRLALTPPGPVNVKAGASAPVTITAYDAQDNIVLTAPDAWAWKSSDGTVAQVTANGNPATVSGVTQGAVSLTGTLADSADPNNPGGTNQTITVPVTVGRGGLGCVANFATPCGAGKPQSQDPDNWYINCQGTCEYIGPK